MCDHELWIEDQRKSDHELWIEDQRKSNHEKHEKRIGESGGGDVAELIYREESYKIMGACFEVYKIMGRGFLEAVYQECLEIEFTNREIPFISQHALPIIYKGRTLNQFYRADFICYDRIIIEVKAVSQLIEEHRAQAINYLRATRMRLAILVNFCASPELEHDRLVL
jgi:GxxExxY protein